MRIVAQRVISSYVKVDGNIVSHINRGLNLLVGFKKDDFPFISDKFDKIIEKIINYRIFEDDFGKMNLSLVDIDGEVLIVSQFTLYGDLSRGRRPSFDSSLEYEKANFLFDIFKDSFCKKWNKVKWGVFGAKMEVGIVNDGPVTFILEF
jgi:D-tyrosyl-tRNA(Tyr) deacylase